MKGILLDEKYDLQVRNGHLDIGDATMQEVGLILMTNKGEWKEWPIMGAGLLEYIRGSEKVASEVEQKLRLQLNRDGKNYDDIKNYIKIKMKT